MSKIVNIDEAKRYLKTFGDYILYEEYIDKKLAGDFACVTANAIQKLRIKSKALLKELNRIEEIKKDAARYRYIRENQSWLRFEHDDYSIVGCKFPYKTMFTARIQLDDNIDKLIEIVE